VTYNLYYDTESPIPFDGGTVVLSDVGTSGTGGYDFKYTLDSLASETTYYFAVRTQDSATPPNEDDNTVEVSATPDNTPPSWVDTTGAQEASAYDGDVTIYWNTASDSGTPPVSYNVYLDEETPIPFDSGTVKLEDVGTSSDTEYDLETTVLGLESETTWYFIVRAQDSADSPNEDTNTVEVSATPDTDPPVWTGREGAETAMPDNGSVTVLWGPAIDLGSSPVTYNLYYDTETPIPFDSGTVKISNAGDGETFHDVTGLQNGITYYFIVRAQDSANPPNEDTNTEEVSAVPEPQWETGTVESTGNVGQHTSAVFDDAENSLIAYYDVTNGNLKFAEWNGSGWSIETVDSPNNVGQAASLALDSDGNPAISYFDASNSDVRFAWHDGSDWNPETVEDQGAVGDFTSLAFDPDGYPGIAYNFFFSGVWYAHWNGSSWDTEEIDGGGLSIVGDWCSLVYDGDDPLVSYYDAGTFNLKLAAWNGTDWDLDTLSSSDDIGRHSSLVLDGSGLPAVSLLNDTADSLEIARFDGSDWSRTIVDDTASVGRYTSIAVTSDGRIFISYYDETNGNLKVAEFDGTWDIDTLDSGGDVGQYTSIALSDLDLPFVSYYDATNGNLKYAWLK
jgi:hypothetical protein